MKTLPKRWNNFIRTRHTHFVQCFSWVCKYYALFLSKHFNSTKQSHFLSPILYVDTSLRGGGCPTITCQCYSFHLWWDRLLLPHFDHVHSLSWLYFPRCPWPKVSQSELSRMFHPGLRREAIFSTMLLLILVQSFPARKPMGKNKAIMQRNPKARVRSRALNTHESLVPAARKASSCLALSTADYVNQYFLSGLSLCK